MGDKQDVFFHIATITPTRADPTGFPSAPHHRIVSVSMLQASVADPAQISSRTIEDLDKEPELINWLLGRIIPKEGEPSQLCPSLVTYSGRSFVFPVISHGMLRHGINMPSYWSWVHNGQGKHLDLAKRLSHNDEASTYTSLADYPQLIGLPKRPYINIESKFLDGEYGLVQARLEIDVLIIAMIYYRLYTTNGMSKGAYRHVVKSIVSAYRKHSEHAKEYLGQANKNLVMLS